ncbi:hypothetical protein BES08_29225 (plasmid) [Novosphingobium resinovorum]|uniref:Uncharacterized protein n=1 Tax=Novosphingobium resinovorum TaxID=158500 RepID=A0A1D8AFI7_9SPHN|nr:hypothetical protein BES08_29225 [Novosphingobium resinovorum]
MSLLCLIGRHRPSAVSLTYGKDGDYLALCEVCAVPLARHRTGGWHAVRPLAHAPLGNIVTDTAHNL